MSNICDYFECGKPICEDDKKDYKPPSLVFCEEHSREADNYIEAHDIPGLLSFWVRAGGGAKRMAGVE